MENLFIPVILGTAREERDSEKVAKFILEEVRKYGFRTELLDVRDFRIPATDNSEQSIHAKKFSNIMKTADGLIVVSPEYNHGYPGELKVMLDMLYEEYFRKPIGICGVSSGGLGGSRMVEQLRLVAIEFHMIPIRSALYFPTVSSLFDEKGNIKDSAAYMPKIKAFLDELTWYAKTLKEGRENNK